MINHMHTFKIKLDNIGEVNLIKKKKNSFLSITTKSNQIKFFKIPKGLKIRLNKNFLLLSFYKELNKKECYFIYSVYDFLEIKNKTFTKKLLLHGQGFIIKKDIKNNNVIFKIGNSHYHRLNLNKENPKINLEINSGNEIELEISGPDKVALGDFLHKIKNLKVPDPYKGKGFSYKNEVLVLKDIKKK